MDRISSLEKPETVTLSLSNQILTSDDEPGNDNSADSNGSDSNSSTSPQGGKVTRQFLPHAPTSKAQYEELIKSINSLGAHILGLDAVVDHVSKTVNTHSAVTPKSISTILESQIALSQRLAALEDNQDSIQKNHFVIKNLLCEFATASGISTDDVPKGEKRKREIEDRKRVEVKKKTRRRGKC